jgi:hypothetical protein
MNLLRVSRKFPSSQQIFRIPPQELDGIENAWRICSFIATVILRQEITQLGNLDMSIAVPRSSSHPTRLVHVFDALLNRDWDGNLIAAPRSIQWRHHHMSTFGAPSSSLLKCFVEVYRLLLAENIVDEVG